MLSPRIKLAKCIEEKAKEFPIRPLAVIITFFDSPEKER